MDAFYVDILGDLAAALSAPGELAALIERATRQAAMAFDGGVVVWEDDRARERLVVRQASGWILDVPPGQPPQLARSEPFGAAMLSGHPVLVADWRAELGLPQPTLLRDCGVVGSLAVAIPGPMRPWGALAVDATGQPTFGQSELSLLRAMANLLGLAIQRVQAIAGQIKERTHDIEEQQVAATQAQAVLEERHRLARDLHDSVTQALYGVTLHSQAARRLLLAGDTAGAGDALAVLQETAQEALDEMRLLIFELRPPILEQVGLEMALQSRLSAVEGRANLHTKLIAEGVADLPAAVEQGLYRIAQEALNNTLKHANARQVSVRLIRRADRVSLEVHDDGDGFEPAARPNGGLGLDGIAERVTQLGGTLTVESAPGAGTLVHVEIRL